MIPYPSYKSTNLPWLPKIPEHWTVNKVRHFYHSILGKMLASSQTDSTYTYEKYLCAKDVHFSGVDLSDLKEMWFSPEEKKKYQIKAGDLLVVEGGAGAGGAAIFKGFGESLYIQNSIHRVRPKTDNVTVQFLYYWLCAFVRRKYVDYACNKATIPHFTGDKLSEMPFVLAPLAEQEQIVRYLDSMTAKINKLIRAKMKQIALLQEQRQAIINRAVTKGLDTNVEMKDSGIDWLGKIPKHWKIQRLGHFSSLQNGISAPAEYFGSGFPFVGYGDVYNNYEIPSTISGRAKSSNEEQKRYSVQEGDIFFTRTSETMEEIAFSSVCRESIPHATFSGFLIRVRPHKRVISTLFAKYYFRNMNLRNYFVKEMNLVTRASLSQQLLRNLPVILPPIVEQEEIAQKIEAENKCITLVINKLEHEITLFDEYKKSLISSVVTGQIDVRNVPVEDVFSDDLIAEDDPSSEIEEEPANESEE